VAADDVDPMKYRPSKDGKKAGKKESTVVRTTFYWSTYDGVPAAEYEFKDEELQEAKEYGYGFWLR
jgi:hypothetical protein